MTQNKDGRAALLGLSFAFMGVLKLAGLQRAMFRRWGLSGRQMRAVGAIETLGALMVARPGTRTLGAAGLAALSVAMLVKEAGNGEAELVLPRLALLLVAAQEATARPRLSFPG